MKSIVTGIAVLVVVLLAGETLQAQWVPMKGPYGGHVYEMTSIGGTMYAGTDGGVYRSTDEGISWSLTTTLLENSKVTRLIADDSVLFLTVPYEGVMRSSDEGATWMALNVDLRNVASLPLVKTSTSLLVGARDEVYRTTDEGATWTHAPVDVNPTSELSELFVHGQYVFAIASYDGLYRSSDDGLTWIKVYTGDDNPQHGVSTSNSIILTYYQGVRRSTDNGLSWIPYNPLGLKEMAGLAARGTTVYLSTGDSSVYRSTDDGASWSLLTSNFPPAQVHAFAFSAISIFAMTGKGIYRSADGIAWSQINDGIQGTTVSAFAANQRYVFAATFGSGVYRSSDSGASWWSADIGLYVNNIYAISVHDQQLFVGTDYGVWVSTNDGTSWQWQNAGLDLSPDRSFVTTFISANDVLYAGTSQHGVFMKARGATYWRPLNTGIEQFTVYSLAKKDAYLIAGSNSRVASSTDNGTTWTVSKEWLPTGQFRYLTANDTYFFASTDSGVHRSSDNGITWIRANTGMEGVIVSSLLIHGPNIFASTYNDDVYVTTDNGDTWKSIGAILDKRSTFALTVVGTDLLVGVRDAGVWRRRLGEVVSSVHNETNEPTHETPLHTYPNPSDAATTITFSLAQPGFTTLNIFNTRGQCIATLISEHIDAGLHSVQWDSEAGTGVAGGLYSVRMQSGGQSRTVYMIVVK